jgi:membrane protease YdiL (CAAX protease family)
MLTLLAWAVATFTWATLSQWLEGVAAFGVGLAVGYGGVGTLAARGVPSPPGPRIGLRGFPARQLLLVALLVPAVLLVSEIDNWVRPLFPALAEPGETAEADEGALALLAVEYAISAVLLRPVLEEFFFRGVVQQGVVAWLGRSGGVALTSLLYVVAAAGFGFPHGPQHAASLAAQAALLGPLLGLLRLATGSLLAPILAQMAMAALGLLAVSQPDALPIAGFNAAGAHTPLEILLPAALSVALGIALALRDSRTFDPRGSAMGRG